MQHVIRHFDRDKVVVSFLLTFPSSGVAFLLKAQYYETFWQVRSSNFFCSASFLLQESPFPLKSAYVVHRVTLWQGQSRNIKISFLLVFSTSRVAILLKGSIQYVTWHFDRDEVGIFDFILSFPPVFSLLWSHHSLEGYLCGIARKILTGSK